MNVCRYMAKIAPTSWRLACLISLATILLRTAPSGQEATLTSMKDVARRTGGTATSKIHVEPSAVPFAELVQSADLIVHARLETMTTRLSDDESTIFRDFTLAPI